MQRITSIATQLRVQTECIHRQQRRVHGYAHDRPEDFHHPHYDLDDQDEHAQHADDHVPGRGELTPAERDGEGFVVRGC